MSADAHLPANVVTKILQGANGGPGDEQVLKLSGIFTAVIALVFSLLCLPAGAAPDPEKVIATSCGGCHVPKQGDGWTRISKQRKTPEGWQMTIARMRLAHKAQIVDPDGGDSKVALRAVVKHLSDNHGLAPAETKDYRYILEQELNTVEEYQLEEFAQMCARCHSGARVALQRRTGDEWRNLVHFHLGQFPTTEYQMMGRDRDWKGKALDEMVAYLTEYYPLQTDEWEAWSAAPKPVLEGRWRVAGNMPGRGQFSGVMVASGGEGDQYKLEMSGSFLDGTSFDGSGSAIVYTSYEWRASLKVDGVSYRQVMAASEDGSKLSGRMFEREHSERGLRLTAWHDIDQPQVIAVQPAGLRAGHESEVRIVGTRLEGDVTFGGGVRVVEVLSRDVDEIRLRVAAQTDVAEGVVDVRVGDAVLGSALSVYQTIDRLSVEPDFAIARVGGDGGSQPVVKALFDAVAWTNGPDGEAGTADDLRIGPVNAQWAVEPWNEQAIIDEDVRFAGAMDKDKGVFTPGAAGPNPQRKYQTNNAGNLKVLATVSQGDNVVEGDSHLIVTVQRWNNPPIR